MELLSVGISAAILVAVVLLIAYLVATGREKGRDPHYSQEVYLYRGPREVVKRVVAQPERAFWGDSWARPNSSATMLATAAQVALYAAAGGDVSHAGITADNPDPGQKTAPGALGGVWLYGPKPHRGTRGVVPFSSAHWFQWEGSGPSFP